MIKLSFTIPTFFILSFFFCHDLLISKNIKKIKIRFERMIIPYILWPIIIWIINHFLKFFVDLKIKISFYDLKMQLLTGHTYIIVLWFQYNLIFITLLLVIFEFLITRNKLFIFINLEIIAYYFQYSNLNLNTFSEFNYNKKYTFGRFFEVIPFCLTGYIFASLKIINYLKKTMRIKSIFIFSLILVFMIKYNIFTITIGFMYQGIKLQIISVVLFCIFSLMPSEAIKNECIIKIIKLITNNTAGIYYLHLIIREYTKNFVKSIQYRTLRGCLIIYIINYVICFFGSIIFKKTKLIHLFQ